jgi:hypothetical protein
MLLLVLPVAVNTGRWIWYSASSQHEQYNHLRYSARVKHSVASFQRSGFRLMHNHYVRSMRWLPLPITVLLMHFVRNVYESSNVPHQGLGQSTVC